MWIDTHAHLDAAEFDADRPAMIQRARAAGVAQVVLPAIGCGNFDTVRELAAAEGLSYGLGIHPIVVNSEPDDAPERLRTALQAHRDDPRLVAVGEIGLDLFVPGLQRERQEAWFAAQLKLAREFALPVLLHTRRAVDVVLKHLRRVEVPGGIAHAFNGSEQQAQVFIELGFKLGFGGALTFERAHQIRRLAQTLPVDSLVLETDAPDIPPHWLYKTAAQRAAGESSRNEPAALPRIAAELAALRGMQLAELQHRSRANTLAALPRLAALVEP
ncbi:TatD family hydrolase [Aquabacterium sp. A7-Y]|uniref:TatD family hydrolase n=1 Tax=Aquabacterium sp. A7-Y TaxID=1349605 RepID=UPI00223DF057|nr:TatD family hydrolase [Aquabacterium sp. A7-Y]MCW7536394.1 TatD family hydrolase [Aquabacterium sp. A7-Y]